MQLINKENTFQLSDNLMAEADMSLKLHKLKSRLHLIFSNKNMLLAQLQLELSLVKSSLTLSSVRIYVSFLQVNREQA